MAFWSSQTLEIRLADLVDPHNVDLVDCNAVTLRVGREIYITPTLEQPAPASHTKRLLEPDAAFTIPPGQFGFIQTEETVSVPRDAMGFISVKAKFKLRGLVNVSGFHVDPGWRGRLIFSVFNAGPAPVHLERGLPLFLLWVADLDRESQKHKTTPGPPGIPVDMINNITGATDSIYDLDKRMRDEIKKLSDKDTDLSDRMHAIDKTQNRILIGFGLAGAILLAVLTVAIRGYVEPILKRSPPTSNSVPLNDGAPKSEPILSPKENSP